MKAYYITIILAIFILSCTGGQKRTTNYVKLETGFALGTNYNCTVNMTDTVGLRGAIDSLFAEVTQSMSLYQYDSRLNRLNRNETDTLDAHIAYCIETAAVISEISGGEYDITLKPVIDAWGFNAGVPGERPNLDSLMQFVGYEKISAEDGRLVKTDPRVQIDLNSIAKGYAADLLAQLVKDRGATDYLVEIGGEVVCEGLNAKGKEWTVGVDKPIEGNVPGEAFQAILKVGSGALATSGNYRKFYTDPNGNKIVHTVSGVTGDASQGDMLSATIVADKCIVADAWATALMAVGITHARQLLETHPEIEGYLIYINEKGKHETWASPKLESRIIR